MQLTYPERLSLSQRPTPLHLLSRLSSALAGPRIWVKRDDLTGTLLSGNKIRKLEFVLAKAQHEQCDTLITCGGIQSNHCRSTALAGAQLGKRVHLILRGKPDTLAEGNFLLDQLSGATISTYSESEYRRLPQLVQQCVEYYQQQGHKPFFIPTGASDGIGVWGYISACQELQQDFEQHGIEPEYIVCATGSGGTQAGLTMGCYLYNLPARVVGMAVCDNAAWFHQKISEDLSDWLKRYPISVDLAEVNHRVSVIDDYIGEGYARASSDVFKTIKKVAQLEGLVLDPVYTGKAFHGLIQEIQKGNWRDAKDIVFVHTGGLFGLFAQRQQLMDVLS